MTDSERAFKQQQEELIGGLLTRQEKLAQLSDRIRRAGERQQEIARETTPLLHEAAKHQHKLNERWAQSPVRVRLRATGEDAFAADRGMPNAPVIPSDLSINAAKELILAEELSLELVNQLTDMVHFLNEQNDAFSDLVEEYSWREVPRQLGSLMKEITVAKEKYSALLTKERESLARLTDGHLKKIYHPSLPAGLIIHGVPSIAKGLLEDALRLEGLQQAQEKVNADSHAMNAQIQQYLSKHFSREGAYGENRALNNAQILFSFLSPIAFAGSDFSRYIKTAEQIGKEMAEKIKEIGALSVLGIRYKHPNLNKCSPATFFSQYKIEAPLTDDQIRLDQSPVEIEKQFLRRLKELHNITNIYRKYRLWENGFYGPAAENAEQVMSIFLKNQTCCIIHAFSKLHEILEYSIGKKSFGTYLEDVKELYKKFVQEEPDSLGSVFNIDRFNDPKPTTSFRKDLFKRRGRQQIGISIVGGTLGRDIETQEYCVGPSDYYSKHPLQHDFFRSHWQKLQPENLTHDPFHDGEGRSTSEEFRKILDQTILPACAELCIPLEKGNFGIYLERLNAALSQAIERIESSPRHKFYESLNKDGGNPKTKTEPEGRAAERLCAGMRGRAVIL